MQDPGKFLRLEEVTVRTALSRSEIYKRVQEKTFPPPLKLAARLSVWVEREVIEWQNQQIGAR